jgi:hypothetical protein
MNASEFPAKTALVLSGNDIGNTIFMHSRHFNDSILQFTSMRTTTAVSINVEVPVNAEYNSVTDPLQLLCSRN